MSARLQRSSLVFEPEILARGAGRQVSAWIRWAAGVDLNYDVSASNVFEDSALIELMAHHPQADVPNVAPATVRSHDASH